MEGSKTCTKCGVVKLFSEFWKCTSMKDGLKSACKACSLARMHALYKANPEKTIARSLEWCKANPEKAAAAAKRKTKKQMEEATFSYVANLLRVSASELPYDLYLLKREQILNTRALRQFNEALKGINDGKRSDTEQSDGSDFAGIGSSDQRGCEAADSGNNGRA